MYVLVDNFQTCIPEFAAAPRMRNVRKEIKEWLNTERKSAAFGTNCEKRTRSLKMQVLKPAAEHRGVLAT